MYKEPRDKALENYKEIEIATKSDFKEYLVDDSDPLSKEWGCKWTTIKTCVQNYTKELKEEAIKLALKIDKTFILSIPLNSSDYTYIIFKDGVQVYSCTSEISIDYIIRKKLLS